MLMNEMTNVSNIDSKNSFTSYITNNQLIIRVQIKWVNQEDRNGGIAPVVGCWRVEFYVLGEKVFYAVKNSTPNANILKNRRSANLQSIRRSANLQSIKYQHSTACKNRQFHSSLVISDVWLRSAMLPWSNRSVPQSLSRSIADFILLEC
ncbi:hypothetical protein LXL04_023454 [Taraxacum kok-saghyz]